MNEDVAYARNTESGCNITFVMKKERERNEGKTEKLNKKHVLKANGIF